MQSDMPARFPYVQDANTGKTRTREYVEMFLEGYASPTRDKSGSYCRSIHDTLFGATPAVRELLYINKAKDSIKTYVGRAARISDGRNAHENLWCVKIDIANACRQLDDQTRRALAHYYITQYEEHTIAQLLGISERAVGRMISTGLDKIARILDYQDT